jgi:hypothetical protein
VPLLDYGRNINHFEHLVPFLSGEVIGQQHERIMKLMHVSMLLTISSAKLIYYVQTVEFYSLFNLQNQQFPDSYTQYQHSGHKNL